MCSKVTDGTLSPLMLHTIEDLELNFHSVTREVTSVTQHPIDLFVRRHPFHTQILNEPQFNLLNYGVIVEKETGLVLIRLPPVLDSESRVSRSGKPVARSTAAGGPSNTTEDPTTVSRRETLLKEYNFLLYKVPEKWECEDGEEGVPLFRLLFRNESNQPDRPAYRLNSVFVSQVKYYPLLGRLKQLDSASEKADVIRTSRIFFLVDMWMQFLGNIHSVWTPPPLEGQSLTWPTLSTVSATPSLSMEEMRVAIPFNANKERVIRRVQVMRRDGEAIAKWRKGELDPRYIKDDPEHLTLLTATAQCMRVIMKTTRGPAVVTTDSHEICVPMPETLEYSNPLLYTSPAAECLRVWLTKALTAAEVYSVHSLFLEIDPFIIFSVCAGLLSDEVDSHFGMSILKLEEKREEYEKDRHAEVLSKIVVETVADYILHSGVVWEVYIAAFDYEDTETHARCEKLLQQYWQFHEELQQQKDTLYPSALDEVENLENTREGITEEGEDTALASSTSPPGGASVHTTVPPPPSGTTKDTGDQYLSKNVVHRANSSGVKISDEAIKELFITLAGSDRISELPVPYLVDVLRVKVDPAAQDQITFLFPFGHPLAALDNCGIPTDERSVTNFVLRFALRFKALTHGVATPNAIANASLNLDEFAMMVLALASM